MKVQEVIPSASIFPELYDQLVSRQGPCPDHSPRAIIHLCAWFTSLYPPKTL